MTGGGEWAGCVGMAVAAAVKVGGDGCGTESDDGGGGNGGGGGSNGTAACNKGGDGGDGGDGQNPYGSCSHFLCTIHLRFPTFVQEVRRGRTATKWLQRNPEGKVWN